MTDLTTTRWKRYGKDRLYVKTTDGVDVGHVDLLTGEITVNVPEFEREVRDLASHQISASRSLAIASPPIDVPCAPTVPSPIARSTAWPARSEYDLAANAAGAAARAKHEEVNSQAPVRNLVARLLGVPTDERAWRVGAKGEQKVGRKLVSLPEGWHHLNAVPIGNKGSDIDHVVIGPGGVFTINTKHHPGGTVRLYENAVWVNGHSKPYLRNSRFEAERASKLLTAACAMQVEVKPVIVFVDLDKLDTKGVPADVAITTLRDLRRFLTQQPTQLTQLAADHIHVMARSSVTWQSA
jgi:Nuclease-related domain